MKNFAKIILFSTLLVILCPALAVESYTKLWSSATVTSPIHFDNSDRFRYYLEPQVRFIDDRYKFNQFLFLTGLGYQLTPDTIAFIGPGWVVDKSLQGEVGHEVRLWEQLSWVALHNEQFILNVRTRLEERKNFDYTQVAYRLRSRAWLRVPLPRWSTHSLSLFDEVFFDLNHPEWVSPKFFSQNRAFIGIGTQLNQSTVLDIGYLNQYLLSKVNQLDNVLLIAFTINL